jgi:hypothetical protein
MGDASGQLGCTVFEKLIDESSDYVPRGGTIVDYDDEHYTVLRVGHAGPEFLQLARGGCQPVEPMPNRRSIKAPELPTPTPECCGPVPSWPRWCSRMHDTEPRGEPHGR